MINPLNDKQLERLQSSIDWSIKQLEYTKERRVSAIEDFVGFHYAEGKKKKKMPVNMAALSIAIYKRLLLARTPRVMISTKNASYKPTAANLELAVNLIPDEINLTDTLEDAVLETLFSMGIVKVGLYTVGTAFGQKYGESFVDLITMDDYFCDMAAKLWSRIDYEGNDYWADYDELMEADWAEKESKKDLKPDDYTSIGPNGEERAEGMSVDSPAKTYKDKILLRDVWLPKEKLLITYGVKSKKRFSTVELKDPEQRPYRKLGYNKVPGNLLPLPPISLWRDLNELANALYRKLGDGADAEKTILGFPGGNDESVADFKAAKDGWGIKYTGSDPKKLQAGGMNPNTLAFFLQTKDLASYFANNLDTLGGLSIQSQTVGQEKLLGDAASAQLRDMADKTIIFVKDIFKTLAYHEWSDPIKSRTLEKPVPGTDMKIPIKWNKESKQSNFSSYNLDVDVYSLQDGSPQTKLQKLKMLVDGFIVPAGPVLQQAGAAIDWQKIIEDATKFMGMSCEGPYVQFAEPSSEQQGSNMPPAGMPANTTRTYERVGRPGMTNQGASAAMQQLLVGGNPGGGAETANP